MPIKMTSAYGGYTVGQIVTLSDQNEINYVERGVAVYANLPTTSDAKLSLDPVTGAVRGVMGLDGLPIATHDKIRNAISTAKGNNSVELEPWLLPPLWTITTTYYNGQLVRNSAGNAYMMWHNQASIGVGVVSTGTEPVHKTQVPTLDGASGVYWMYMGKARGLTSGTQASATPAAATDTMVGYVACANTGTPDFVSTTLGLTRNIGAEFSYTNFPARIIGLRDTSLADSAIPAMLGTNIGTVGTPNYAASGIHYGIHFKTNSRWLFIQSAAPVYTGVDFYSIEANGRRISDSAMTRPNASNKQGRLIDLSKFPGTEKDVRIFGNNSLRDDLSYIMYLEPTAYVLPGEVANNFKIAFEGDSLTTGTMGGNNGLPTSEGDIWTSNAARLLGASNWYSNASGGTGFIADNSSTGATYINRLDRINLFAPDVLVVMGGQNDGAATSAQRTAAALLYLQTFRAANPNAYIFMFGNLLLQGQNVSTYAANELDIKAAVTTFNDARCIFVPILSDPKGSWYAGGSINGNYFYTTGSAPFVNTHHTIGAYKMLESQVTAAIRSYFAA